MNTGRPKKTKATKQSVRVLLTLTPSEAARLKHSAGTIPAGTWARALVLRALASGQTEPAKAA